MGVEVGLNLVWLLVVAASFVAWRRGARRSACGARRPQHSRLVFLACLLFLLFPVISLDDDAQSISAAQDEGGAQPNAVKKYDPSGDGPEKAPAATLAGICCRPLVCDLPVVGLVAEGGLARPYRAVTRACRGRAPPSLLT